MVSIFIAFFFIFDISNPQPNVPESISRHLKYPYKILDYQIHSDFHGRSDIFVLIEMEEEDIPQQISVFDEEIEKIFQTYYTLSFPDQFSIFEKVDSFTEVINERYTQSYFVRNDDKSIDAYFILENGNIAVLHYDV